MVDAWRKARVARPKQGTPNVDTEAFQAVTWDRYVVPFVICVDTIIIKNLGLQESKE